MPRKRSAARKDAPRRKETGLAPGTPVYTGAVSDVGVQIRVIDFDADTFTDVAVTDLGALAPFKARQTVTWIDVTGLHKVEIIQAVCQVFDVHALAVEDIVSTGTRPKCDDYGEQVFLVAKMIRQGPEQQIVVEHTSMVLGPHYVLTFQETPGDVFEPVRKRIFEARGRLRTHGADYLAYALLDAIVDHYFVVLDEIRNRAEDIEDNLLRDHDAVELASIYELRRELVFLRRHIAPLRDAVTGLLRHEQRVTHRTHPFLRDLMDHLQQAVDHVETYRDMLMGLIDLQVNLVGHRMNETMGVLTVIATIFIPLTFIAGVYGMNFDHMPELHWRFGYPAVWVLMVALSASLFGYFRKRGLL